MRARGRELLPRLAVVFCGGGRLLHCGHRQGAAVRAGLGGRMSRGCAGVRVRHPSPFPSPTHPSQAGCDRRGAGGGGVRHGLRRGCGRGWLPGWPACLPACLPVWPAGPAHAWRAACRLSPKAVGPAFHPPLPHPSLQTMPAAKHAGLGSQPPAPSLVTPRLRTPAPSRPRPARAAKHADLKDPSLSPSRLPTDLHASPPPNRPRSQARGPEEPITFTFTPAADLHASPPPHPPTQSSTRT